MNQPAVEKLQAIQALVDSGYGPGRVETLQQLLRRTCELVGAEAASVVANEDSGARLVPLAKHGKAADSLVEMLLSGELLRKLAEGMQPLVLDRSSASPWVANLPPGIHAAMVAPLVSEGNLAGVAVVGSSQPACFGKEQMQLFQLVADRAGSILEHTSLFEQVRAGRERSQILAQQLMEAQEAERRHLARELHDEIGQALTAIKINLQAVCRSVKESAASGRLEESIGIVDRVLQQVRNLSLDLRPSLLDDLGLAAALRWYLDRQAKRAGFSAEFAADPPEIRAPARLETACFRVAQEALTNVVRHAQAKQVRAELRQHDNQLELRIQDDGIGFDVAAARQRAARGQSLGLLGMQERVLLIGGRIEIDSDTGRGTTIAVRFPLSALPALERRKRRRGPG